MSDPNLDALRYPVGKFKAGPPGSAADRARWIDEIERAPANIATLVSSLSSTQLATPYREGGWTGAQVVHHVADSHMNAYLRIRWAITEDGFTVKPYPEAIWAELPDAKALDVSPSVDILRGIHKRWVTLLRSLSEEQFARPLLHPERGPISVDWMLQLYSWHGRHHAGHLGSLREK